MSAQPPLQVLSRRRLNRALMARQLLDARRAADVRAVFEHLVGMQAQEPIAPYIGLWSRLRPFDPERLSALIAGGQAVRGPLMRATIHVVTRRDYAALWPLMRPMLERSFRASPFARQIPADAAATVATAGGRLLADRPRTRAELAAELRELWPAAEPLALAYAVTYLEPVVQIPPRGLWRQGGPARWARFPDAVAEPAVDEVILRYLAAYGPATVRDIQAWSGLRHLRERVERLGARLRTFADEHGNTLYDVPDAPLPDEATELPPRFLPPFDNVLLAHADRRRVIADADRRALSRDRLMRAFLIDGVVAGTWSLAGPELHVRPLRPLAGPVREAMEEEARRLLEFAGHARDGRVELHCDHG